MAGAKAQQPIKIKRRIGSTTYIVTSHFQKEGSTAKDKIRCLIDMNTRPKNFAKKADF
ncbi:MAG: transposon-encoded TnpW family protein [Oscillospiraceae bacterium]|nr:transposon-encoded TnpW family protein [Oscillospiraceae bacterium]